MLILSLDNSTLHLIRILYYWGLSKEVSSTIFKVFDMTRSEFEPRSPRPLANTLPTKPILLLFTSWEFFTSALADGLWLEFEWQQISWNLLSILADLNNTVVWIVSNDPLIVKSFSSCTNPSVTTKSTNYNWYHRHFHVSLFFFYSQISSRYLSFFSHSLSFILWSSGSAKFTTLRVLFFLLIIMRSGFLAEIRWSVRISKSHMSLCASFSRTVAGLWIYHLLVWSK